MPLDTVPQLGFNISAAMAARMGEAPGSEKRKENVGASEVGGCMRLAVHFRLNGQTFSDESMDNILLGKAGENETIQLIRATCDGWEVKATGRNQAEFFANGAPLFSHPDALMTFKATGETVVLDVKRPRGTTVTKAKAGEVWTGYEDQIIAQCGTAIDSGTPVAGGFLFFQDKASLRNFHAHWVPFDEQRYEDLKARATDIIQWVEVASLPPGEVNRGFCGSCPIKQDCPQYQQVRINKEGKGMDALVMADLEVLTSEIKRLTLESDPLTEEIETLKEQVKKLMADNNIPKAQLPNGVTAVLTEATRSTLDSKALKSKMPEIAAQFTKETTTVTLKVTFDKP